MRTSGKQINEILKRQISETFSQLIIDLKNEKETSTFLADFFNDAERETYAKRLAVAYWLKKGRSYTNIKENLKVSSATIASVEKLMKKPGLILAIKKLEAEEWANVWVDKIRKIVK